MPNPPAPTVSAARPPEPSASGGVRTAVRVSTLAGVALAVFALALALYMAGLAPGLLWGDSAEMQILAAIGGVAHPTGYPLFTLVGRVFTAFGDGDPAWRANLLSATFAAATLALLVAFLIRRGVRPAAAFAGAAAWGLSFTFWSTAQRAEVYSLAAFIALGALWCTLSALQHGHRRVRLAAGFLLGLTLTGHMAFAPCVAVAGLTLAWRVPRTGWSWLGDEIALLAVFAAGLSPYAYLLWADQTGHGLDYLKLVEIARWPTGPVPAEFRSPFARFMWLLLGRNDYPAVPLHPDVRSIARNLSDTTFLLTLFEFGPVAFAAAVTGVRARFRAQRGETWFLCALMAASIVFSVVTSGYKILSVFLIPCYLVVTVFVAHGMQAWAATLARRLTPLLVTAALVLLPFAGAVVAHAARLVTYDHPIGPFKSRVMEEDDRTERALLPSMSGVDEPRRFVESAAQLLPDSALVICEWREFMALLYLQRVQHRRNDLTVHPSGYPILLGKIALWQASYDLARRPVVVVSPLALMARHVVNADTLRLATGQPVVVTRVALVQLRP